jgi:hypothetical protein
MNIINTYSDKNTGNNKRKINYTDLDDDVTQIDLDDTAKRAKLNIDWSQLNNLKNKNLKLQKKIEPIQIEPIQIENIKIDEPLVEKMDIDEPLAENIKIDKPLVEKMDIEDKKNNTDTNTIVSSLSIETLSNYIKNSSTLLAILDIYFSHIIDIYTIDEDDIFEDIYDNINENDLDNILEYIDITEFNDISNNTVNDTNIIEMLNILNTNNTNSNSKSNFIGGSNFDKEIIKIRNNLINDFTDSMHDFKPADRQPFFYTNFKIIKNKLQNIVRDKYDEYYISNINILEKFVKNQNFEALISTPFLLGTIEKNFTVPNILYYITDSGTYEKGLKSIDTNSSSLTLDENLEAIIDLVEQYDNYMIDSSIDVQQVFKTDKQLYTIADIWDPKPLQPKTLFTKKYTLENSGKLNEYNLELKQIDNTSFYDLIYIGTTEIIFGFNFNGYEENNVFSKLNTLDSVYDLVYSSLNILQNYVVLFRLKKVDNYYIPVLLFKKNNNTNIDYNLTLEFESGGLPVKILSKGLMDLETNGKLELYNNEENDDDDSISPLNIETYNDNIVNFNKLELDILEAQNFLLKFKISGDQGQANMTHILNKISNKKLLFLSGDRLAYIYSISINNPTMFPVEKSKKEKATNKELKKKVRFIGCYLPELEQNNDWDIKILNDMKLIKSSIINVDDQLLNTIKDTIFKYIIIDNDLPQLEFNNTVEYSKQLLYVLQTKILPNINYSSEKNVFIYNNTDKVINISKLLELFIQLFIINDINNENGTINNNMKKHYNSFINKPTFKKMVTSFNKKVKDYLKFGIDVVSKKIKPIRNKTIIKPQKKIEPNKRNYIIDFFKKTTVKFNDIKRYIKELVDKKYEKNNIYITDKNTDNNVDSSKLTEKLNNMWNDTIINNIKIIIDKEEVPEDLKHMINTIDDISDIKGGKITKKRTIKKSKKIKKKNKKTKYIKNKQLRNKSNTNDKSNKNIKKKKTIKKKRKEKFTRKFKK